MSKTLSASANHVPAAINGFSTASQYRLMSSLVNHNDMEVPDFSNYRRSGTKDSTRSSEESAASRKNFTYMMVGGVGVASVYSAHKFVNMLLGTLSASRDVLAMAQIEIALGDIPEGKNMTFKWRGKPLFVRHRLDCLMNNRPLFRLILCEPCYQSSSKIFYWTMQTN